MHKLKNILVLMSIVTLFLACEKEEAGYTPQIATYNELQYEIGRQVKSAGSYNSVLDSTVVKSVFSTYLDLLNETNNHLSYLQIYVNNLVTNEQDATLRERYNKVKAELDINVAKWKTAAANYGEFKSRNIIPVYLAFNSMKLFLYSPNFSRITSYNVCYTKLLRGSEPDHLKTTFPCVDAIPFESERQFMATLHGSPSMHHSVIYLKGAVEKVLGRCDRMLDEGGRETALDEP